MSWPKPQCTCNAIWRTLLQHRGVISTFSWGAKIFLNFSMPLDYWKIGKNNTSFVVIWRYLFIVPFFLLFSFLSLFFFLFFCFSFFPWGGATASPAPKWRLCYSTALIDWSRTNEGVLIHSALDADERRSGAPCWDKDVNPGLNCGFWRVDSTATPFICPSIPV